MKDRKIITILTMFTIIFTVLGGTLAYFNWTTNIAQRTNVTFTVTSDFSCSADGGGNITNNDAILAPASCTNSTYAIQRTVTVHPEIFSDGINTSMDLWLNVINIGTGLSNSQNFKYALTTDSNSCTSGVVTSGNFNGTGTNSIVSLLDDKIYSNTKTETYYLYIWLDAAETSSDTMNQTFSLSLNGTCTSMEPLSTQPDLDDRMVPVVISDTGTVTTISSTDEDWYDYPNKEWANAVLVNKNATSGVTGSHDRAYYLANPGTTVVESDILAYYVWIPRYKYKLWTTNASTMTTPRAIDIKFEAKSDPITSGKSVGEYMTHPAFIRDGETVAGIWVGKFESTGDATKPTIKPNTSPLMSQNISAQFTSGLMFAGGTQSGTTVTFSGSDVYGLTANTDSHMMKNSEWASVAYLSHSQYGANTGLDKNSSFGDNLTTGYGSSTPYGTPSSGTSVYGQSTTGNIYGVFDMSGGSMEYVMGVASDTSGEPMSGYDTQYNSGFNGSLGSGSYKDGISFPSAKYFDLYARDPLSSCYSGQCYGHALSETAKWYGTYYFINLMNNPWVVRSINGIFEVVVSPGDASQRYSWRSVLIVG